jgi:cellobiose transport system permease protein
MSINLAIRKIVLYFLILIGVLIFLFPFLFMVMGSFKETSEILSIHLTFLPKEGFNLRKYTGLIKFVDFDRALLNTTVVASCYTLLALFFCSLAGFAFAKYDFRGREPLFYFLLVTMMLPMEAGVVASYLLMAWFKWLDSYYPLIIPGMASAFGIFLMRQYISSIPSELLDAAKIDGCSCFQIYYRIILPLVQAGLIVLGTIFFMITWNDFFWPLIILNSPEKFTVQLAMARLNKLHHEIDFGMMLAGGVLTSLPLIIIFLLLHKRIVKGMLEGSLKF